MFPKLVKLLFSGFIALMLTTAIIIADTKNEVYLTSELSTKIWSAVNKQFQSELNQFQDLIPTELGEETKLRLGSRACWRNAKGRSARVPTTNEPCNSETEVKEDGICYEKCSDKEEGLGPICWSKCRCKYSFKSLFFCCDDKDVCGELVSNLFGKLPLEIVQFILDISRDISDVDRIIEDFKTLVDTILDLTLPHCDAEMKSCDAGINVVQRTEALVEKN
jgi:hypothetical protein